MTLTKFTKPNPLTALNFCMLLRKYLVGAKIKSISSFDLERTVEIRFDCYNELNDLVERKLFIEIMSRQSNIILTNENNIIIDSLRHINNENSSHVIIPHIKYAYPKNNKLNFYYKFKDKDSINHTYHLCLFYFYFIRLFFNCYF